MKFERWGADDPGVIFAKPQELGSKNLYAYCDNNPVAREDYVGEFPIPCIVGAVVGAAVSGFSYVLTRGGEIDGVELAKSCLVGAVSGALAPLDPMKWVVKPLVACAAVINGINTVVNTEGDIGTRLLCRTFEAGATYISGVTANNWTRGKVVLETVSAKIVEMQSWLCGWSNSRACGGRTFGGNKIRCKCVKEDKFSNV